MNTIYTITIIFVLYLFYRVIKWMLKITKPNEIGISDLND